MKVKSASGVASAVSPPRDDTRIHQHSLTACLDTQPAAITHTIVTTSLPHSVTLARTVAKTNSLACLANQRTQRQVTEPACVDNHRTIPVATRQSAIDPVTMRAKAIMNSLPSSDARTVVTTRPLSVRVASHRPLSECVATTRPLSACLTQSETVV